MSEDTQLVLFLVTAGIWTIIETRIEVKLGINKWPGRIILGVGCSAIFYFYAWLYHFYNRPHGRTGTGPFPILYIYRNPARTAGDRRIVTVNRKMGTSDRKMGTSIRKRHFRIGRKDFPIGR